MTPWRELFGFERPDGRGERLHARAFELLVAGWTVQLVWSWAASIRSIGDVVLPLGVAQYVDIAFMFEGPWSRLVAALVTIAMGLGFTRRWRWAYLVAVAGFHLQYVARNCLGEISHGSNLVGMAVLAFGLGQVAFADRTQARRFSMGMVLFFVGLGYTSAAVCKLVATGPGWIDGRHLWAWIGERTVDGISKWGSFEHDGLQRAVLASWPLSTSLLASGLLAESLAWMLWFRRTRVLAGLLLLGMHVGIGWVMDIAFVPNMQILAVVALPWPVLLDRLFTARRRLR